MRENHTRKGPGALEPIATVIAHTLDADGVVLIVCGGPNDGAFEVQLPDDVKHQLPGVLRALADLVERDVVAEGHAADGRADEGAERSS